MKGVWVRSLHLGLGAVLLSRTHHEEGGESPVRIAGTKERACCHHDKPPLQ